MAVLPPIENLAALTPEEATARLLAEPEGQWFDRKSARIGARELAETLVAMANAEGGVIVIGLSGGACEGVDERQASQNDWRQAGVNFTAPPVRYTAELLPCVNRQGEADHLFVIRLPPGRQAHSTLRDVAFLRVGDENRRLSFEQRIELHYDRSDATFESTPAKTSESQDLDSEAVAEYARKVGHPDPQRLLQARELVAADGTLSVAGQLLFGTYPQWANPSGYVRVLKYAGTERLTGTAQNLVDDVRCEGTLPRQIDAARAAVREAMPERKALGKDGKFAWFELVPEEAWLEALVNAVIHRSYSIFGDHIRLTVFDDRIEVFNPGGFPGLALPADLTNVPRLARNPRIARVMAELSYGQELGEGLRRMVTVMEASGRRPPVVAQDSGGTLVTLYAGTVCSSPHPP